jgi:hypothetical protein
MSAHIHSWIDGHLAVRQRAYETRGAIQLDSGARWPRTTGADVVAIAAVFDDAVHLHGTPGIRLRWRATLADLEREALRAPRDTYVENRTFWATLEAVAIFLDDVAVSPPSPPVWDTLLDEIGADLRNVGPTEDGPIAHFDGIKTFDDLWNAQRTYLADKRGSDKLPPPAGMGGTDMIVPRSTNQDVLQLATYWSDQLAKAKQVMGYKTAVDKWKTAIADVDQLAKPGKPGDVYPKNNEFWRLSFEVAVQIAIGDESPSKWDLVVESVKDSVTHLPQNVEAGLSKGVQLVEDAAHTVGKIVGETGKGLLSGLGAPVLIGAGLIGLFLVTRGGDKHEQEA